MTACVRTRKRAARIDRYLEELRLEQQFIGRNGAATYFGRGTGAACQPKAGLNISRFIGRVKHGKTWARPRNG